MDYKRRLWFRFMKNSLRSGWKVYLIFLAAGLLLYVSRIFSGETPGFLGAVLVAGGIALFFLLIFSVTGICFVSQVHSYQRFFEEQGFCPEYRDAFEEKHIRGKTPDHYHRLIYAEIHLRMGDPDRAEFLLGQLRIPESETANRAMYLVLYMHLALFREDSALARDIWEKNRVFLDKLFYENRQKIQIAMLRVCQVGMEAVSGNYGEALSLISRYSGMGGRPLPNVDLDFLALQIYIYHRLGSEENELRSAEYMKNVIENRRFEYPFAEASAYDSLRRAKNGELPI